MFLVTQHMAALRLAMAPDNRSYGKANGLSGNDTSAFSICRMHDELPPDSKRWLPWAV